jgi:CRP-like cAMP-binding protein
LTTISFEPFFSYIESKSAMILNTDEKMLLQSTFRAKHLRKRQYLLQEGDVCKYMSFMIAIENWWLGDYESYNFNTPSRYNIEVVEDSEVLMIEHSLMQKLTGQIPALELMVKEIDRKGTVATQKRIHSSISQSAEERYDNFIASYPELMNRFPQTMIASYLGISPETLSRIRKNMLKK